MYATILLELYPVSVTFIFTGTSDYLNPIDNTVMALANNDAYLSPSIVDDDFYLACMTIVQDHYGLSFDLNRDITVDNSLAVYRTLVNNIPS